VDDFTPAKGGRIQDEQHGGTENDAFRVAGWTNEQTTPPPLALLLALLPHATYVLTSSLTL